MVRKDGLTAAEVKERQGLFGPNALPVPGHRLLKLVLRQFRGVFNLLLMAAAVITFILGDYIDGWFILIFVFLGTGLNVFQEHKSNAAADKLRTYLRSTITVRRDGQEQEVDTSGLVPGDILKLESGDIVPSDALVLEQTDLLVDETTFTGESIPVGRAANETLMQGVVIIRGSAEAEVTAIGEKTKLAGIAATASSVQAESELVKGVDRISNFILKSALITLLFVVLANVFIEGGDTDIPSFLVFAIALAVSVIPEALPLVLTFSLSRGALGFAKKDVIVKRLSAVQDLGSVNLLCTDKTGTITENRLVHINDCIMEGTRFHPLMLARLAAHHLNERIPEPFDRAVDEALSEEQRAELAGYKILEEEPFEPELRSNGSVVAGSGGLRLHIRRGSSEYFLSQGIAGGGEVLEWLAAEESKGHRVLGVSYDDGSGASFGGFVSFVDKLKETTAETIIEAERLNIKITIITGDALMVAQAVGREAGLVKEIGEVMEAKSFLALPIQERKKQIGQIRVFARTTPEQKLELIQMLKEQYTVGYLGEGINDAPALKAAHVSMVVQSAADVARETADIVLLKNDLSVIVDGIRYGRETHANTLKYIRATLVSNFGNFYAVAI
ncbi:MAG TPA: HAD-IC family P-type ATPase, partial [Clostridiaceae bacterium]|nr:HAD-IC family P-type ATPase [Clostridiaceae bacterium]